MEVLSKTLTIKKNEVNFQEIENYLKKIKLKPLRWAVTKINKNSYLIDYSYKK